MTLSVKYYLKNSTFELSQPKFTFVACLFLPSALILTSGSSFPQLLTCLRDWFRSLLDAPRDAAPLESRESRRCIPRCQISRQARPDLKENVKT